MKCSIARSHIQKRQNSLLTEMVSSGCQLKAFGKAFCQNAQPEQAALLAATQRPIALACIKEKSPRPAWKTKPSWYLVAQEDRMINPATQLFLSRRMGARTRSEMIDHTPLVTAPGLVVEMILEAVTSLVASPNK